MTEGKNMQMIAYCPLIAPSKCGLKDAKNHKLDGVTAGKISLIGDTKIITFKKGTAKSGEYDACYWELDTSEVPMGSSVQIKFTKVKNMQSFIYGGASRELALMSVNDNEALAAGDTLLVDGM